MRQGQPGVMFNKLHDIYALGKYLKIYRLKF
jgi:hypothetical protein